MIILYHLHQFITLFRPQRRAEQDFHLLVIFSAYFVSNHKKMSTVSATRHTRRQILDIIHTEHHLLLRDLEVRELSCRCF